ncbi:MAG TPA: hypothetical protein VGS22_23340 [Thermoanaerobaculia bacterium]|jgi:hypothetical protein|nr:hypothetical protein [Thermoanaerobaculia bacterium]
MDYKALADTLTQILTPALPRLIANSIEVSSGTTSDMDRAKAVWSRLSNSVEGYPATAEAVRDVAKDPEDLDAQAVLRVQLRKLLERDKVVAREMARLVDSHGAGGRYEFGATAQAGPGGRAVAAGAGGIAIGGDFGGSVYFGPFHARDRD